MREALRLFREPPPSSVVSLTEMMGDLKVSTTPEGGAGGPGGLRAVKSPAAAHDWEFGQPAPPGETYEPRPFPTETVELHEDLMKRRAQLLR